MLKALSQGQLRLDSIAALYIPKEFPSIRRRHVDIQKIDQDRAELVFPFTTNAAVNDIVKAALAVCLVLYEVRSLLHIDDIWPKVGLRRHQ